MDQNILPIHSCLHLPDQDQTDPSSYTPGTASIATSCSKNTITPSSSCDIMPSCRRSSLSSHSSTKEPPKKQVAFTFPCTASSSLTFQPERHPKNKETETQTSISHKNNSTSRKRCIIS